MPEEVPEQRVKHLEMVQAVIARLGNDSFLVKGWAVTVTTVLLGLAVNGKKPALALVAFLPVAIFWILDTYYLQAERRFRRFYEHIRRGSADVQAFKMDGTGPAFLRTLSKEERKDVSWLRTAFRPTVIWLYLGLALAAVLVAIVSGPDHPKKSSGRARTSVRVAPAKGPAHVVGHARNHR